MIGSTGEPQWVEAALSKMDGNCNKLFSITDKNDQHKVSSLKNYYRFLSVTGKSQYKTLGIETMWRSPLHVQHASCAWYT